MAGILLAQVAGDLYSWIGFAPRTALLLGSMSSLTELLYVEYRDGRSDRWGFSTPDAAADVLGALVPLVHSYVPATRPIHFKYGYFPSPLYRHRNLRRVSGRPFVPSFIDDYEGMTFWMVMNPAPLLNEHATAIWPAWLGLAVGVGTQGLRGVARNSRGPERAYPELPDAQREIYLSLDFDYAHFLGHVRVLRKFTPYLRLRRFPAPALRLHPTRTFYWVLF